MRQCGAYWGRLIRFMKKPSICLIAALAVLNWRRGGSVPRVQIKDEKTYRELRKQGESKEKSARIANASAG